MKKTIYPACAFLCIGLFWTSCGNKPAPPAKPTYDVLKKAEWLLGKWGFATPEGNLSETWTLKNDSTYAGESYFVAGPDTLFGEAMTLEQRGQTLSYVVITRGQTAKDAVSFTLTASTGKELVFENPTHDFPQKITYTQTGPDSLLAEISGNDKGKAASEQFVMGKLN